MQELWGSEHKHFTQQLKFLPAYFHFQPAQHYFRAINYGAYHSRDMTLNRDIPLEKSLKQQERMDLRVITEQQKIDLEKTLRSHLHYLSAPNVFTPFLMGAQLISSLIIYRYSQPNIINRKQHTQLPCVPYPKCREMFDILSLDRACKQMIIILSVCRCKRSAELKC